jgi:hypothetical protein
MSFVVEYILFSILLIGGSFIYYKDWYSQKGFYHYFRVIINIIFGVSLLFFWVVIFDGIIKYIYKHYL